MNKVWNAEKYSSDFSFVHNYDNDVITLIDKENIHSVLDLGCGNGAITKLFAESGLSVIGMDSSKEMLETAKKTYPEPSYSRWTRYMRMRFTDLPQKHPDFCMTENSILNQ